MTDSLEHLGFALQIGVHYLGIVERERECVENFRGSKLREATQQLLDRRAALKEREQPAHGYARAGDVRTAPEDLGIHAHVRMRNENDRKRHDSRALYLRHATRRNSLG